MNNQENSNSAQENLASIKVMDTFMRDGEIKKIENLLKLHPELLHLKCYNSGDNGLLTFAATLGNVGLADFLLQQGANINEYEKYRNTPLHQAVVANHLDMVSWLLTNGAEADGPAQCLYTPLYEASTSGKIACAELLVEFGADINRLNLRANKTPLDAAISWQQREVEIFLRSQNALATIFGNDWPKEYGGPILEFVEKSLGRILPFYISSGVTQRIALANKENNKVLFTNGLFANQTLMVELFIVLSAEWNMYDKSEKNQFPSALLNVLGKQISSGGKIEEGETILADDPRYEALAWPADLAGFFVSDNDWGVDRSHEGEISEDEKVWLLTLIPIKRTKTGYIKQSVEKNRIARWGKLTLAIESDNF